MKSPTRVCARASEAGVQSTSPAVILGLLRPWSVAPSCRNAGRGRSRGPFDRGATSPDTLRCQRLPSNGVDMRHLLSFVLGLILAPLIYVLVGVSESKIFEGLVGKFDIVPEVIAILCALAAGGLYAVLVLARLSPVGTVL